MNLSSEIKNQLINAISQKKTLGLGESLSTKDEAIKKVIGQSIIQQAPITPFLSKPIFNNDAIKTAISQQINPTIQPYRGKDIYMPPSPAFQTPLGGGYGSGIGFPDDKDKVRMMVQPNPYPIMNDFDYYTKIKNANDSQNNPRGGGYDGSGAKYKPSRTTDGGIVGGTTRSMHPMYWEGTPFNNVYLLLKKDSDNFLNSQIADERNVATMVAMKLIPTLLKKADETFEKRAVTMRMTEESSKSMKEAIIQELLPDFKTEFKSAVQEQMLKNAVENPPIKVEPIKVEPIKVEPTEVKPPIIEKTITEVVKIDSNDKSKKDNDKMVLYGGIALVVIAIIMSK